MFLYLDGQGRGAERLQVVRVEHVSGARAQHLENPDGKPLRVTHRIRERQRRGASLRARVAVGVRGAGGGRTRCPRDSRRRGRVAHVARACRRPLLTCVSAWHVRPEARWRYPKLRRKGGGIRVSMETIHSRAQLQKNPTPVHTHL